jgi:hypothetical protein
MNILEKEHDYKEDQFDFIQQTLRTICSYCKFNQENNTNII